MKKSTDPKQVSKDAPPVAAEPVEPEVPQFGFGKFEYKDQSTYVGNWKIFGGLKLKHGHGKLTTAGNAGRGKEEYDGDWVEDKMQGIGRYSFTSGAVYVGQWHKGKMHGRGKITNADGTTYDGEWSENVMNGEGTYVDLDQVPWSGIFINGTFESKVQKKLKAEKEIADKMKEYQVKAKHFFIGFSEAFAKSDKKTFKDNLGPFFATADVCIDFVAEPYSKYEERAPDKWNELIKAVYQDGNVAMRVLKVKEDATVLKSESILVEQMRQKKGGQVVELEATVVDKNWMLALCELVTEQWVLVYCGEKVQ